jgi:hypothetical protein
MENLWIIKKTLQMDLLIGLLLLLNTLGNFRMLVGQLCNQFGELLDV